MKESPLVKTMSHSLLNQHSKKIKIEIVKRTISTKQLPFKQRPQSQKIHSRKIEHYKFKRSPSPNTQNNNMIWNVDVTYKNIKEMIYKRQGLQQNVIDQKQREKKQFSQKCMERLVKMKSCQHEKSENKKSNVNLQKNEKNKNNNKPSQQKHSFFNTNFYREIKTSANEKNHISKSEDKKYLKSKDTKKNENENYLHNSQIELQNGLNINTYGMPNLQNAIQQGIRRSLKSAQLKRQSNNKWLLIPDFMAVKMGRQSKNSQYMHINGVTCYISKPQKIKPIFSTRQKRVRPVKKQDESRKVILSRTGIQNVMKFSNSQSSDLSYMKRIKGYIDFLFKINFSNNIYIPLQLRDNSANDSDGFQNIFKYKAYVGSGNNCLLIKGLLKRRFWFQIVTAITPDVNFVWTQNKVDSLLEEQPSLYPKRHPIITTVIPKKQNKKNSNSTESENEKILSCEQSKKVSNFINNNGHIVPFEENYLVKLVTNHLPFNSMIGSKKKLYKSLVTYYRFLNINPFQHIPLTYHVSSRIDPQFKRFYKEHQKNSNNIWIVKPGENTNQGQGIKVVQFTEIPNLIRSAKHKNGDQMTYIIQKYLIDPFLYNGRKFDIRHYFMLTSVNGLIKAYWYKDGYIRTSSQYYNTEDLDDKFIHLTNDFIQRKSQNYQTFQQSNKLSYAQFQRYLDLNYICKGYNFQKQIIQKSKQIIIDVIKANYKAIDFQRKECNFQIFGIDIMVDSNFKPWLIEINYNPCLEASCPTLNRIIPQMVQCSLRIGLDPLLPLKNHFAVNKRFNLSDNYLKNLRYELIFDELQYKSSDQIEIVEELYDKQEEDQYADDGNEVEEILL